LESFAQVKLHLFNSVFFVKICADIEINQDQEEHLTNSSRLMIDFVDVGHGPCERRIRQTGLDLLKRSNSLVRQFECSVDFFYAASPFFALGRRKTLFAIVSEDNKTIAMVPVEVGAESHLTGQYFSVFRHPSGLTRSGLICPEHRLEEVIAAVFKALREKYPKAVGVSLEGLNSDGALVAILLNTFAGHDLLPRASKKQFFLDLTAFERPEHYLATRSHNLRRSIRRGRKKLEALGPCGFAASGSQGPWTFDDIRRMDQKTWRARPREGDIPKLMLEMCENLSMLPDNPQNCLIRALTINETPVALYFSIIDQGVSYGFKNTFDPDFAEASPGIVAFLSFVEDTMQQNVERIEFMTGSAYLKPFANRERSLRQDVIFFPTLSGRTAYVAAKSARVLRNALKARAEDTHGRTGNMTRRMIPVRAQARA